MSKLLEIFGKAITVDTTDLIWHWLEAVLAKAPEQKRLAELEPILDSMAQMDLESAEEKLKFYLFDQPGCTAGRMLAAAICLRKNDLTGALEALQSVYLREPTNTMALYTMGHCYERLGHEAEAVEFYQDCLKFKNYLQLPRQRLAAIYFKNGQIEKTITEYKELKNEYPDDIASLCILGHLYIANMDYESAIDTFNTAIVIHPDNFHANSIDADLTELLKKGEHYEALGRINQMIEAQPDSADLYVQLADILIATGDGAEAIINYEKAIRIQPSYLEATVKLGSLYLRTGQKALAAEHFNRAVEINDEIVDAYVGLATAQKLADEPDQACATLSLASAIEQNSTILFTKTATLQFQTAMNDYGLGQEDQQDNTLLETVINAHQKQLKAHPNNLDLHYKYGLLMMNITQTQAAQDAFARVIDINPTHYRALTKLILCYLELDEPNEAIRQLTNIETPSKETLQLHYETAILYCDKSRFAVAMKNMKDSSQASDLDMSETNVSISTVLQNLGLLDRATATWDSLRQVTQSALTD